MAKGTRENLAGLVLERGLGIALFIALPLLLAPRTLGLYYEVVALVTVSVMLGTLSLDTGLVRFTALAGEEGRLGAVRGYVMGAVILASCSSFVVVGVLWISAPALSHVFHDPRFVSGLRVASLGIPFFVLTWVLVAPARGLKIMRPTVLVTQLTQPAVQLLAVLALLAVGDRFLAVTGAYTLSAVAGFALAISLLLRLRLPPATRSHERVLRPLVAFSIPVTGMNLMDTALLWVDTLLLGALRGAPEVATYGIVVRLFTMSAAVLFTVVQIFGPFVTQLAIRRDVSGLQRTLRMATRWVVLLSVPILLLLMILGGWIVSRFHRPPGQAEIASLVLGVAFLGDALTGPIGHVLTMSGRSWLNLVNNAAALATNLGLNLLLIPRFGLVGAAVSWAVVILAVNAVRVLEVRRIFRITPFDARSAKPLVAGCAAGGSGLMARLLVQHLLGVGTLLAPMTLVVVFLGVYLVVLHLLGVDPEDRMFARTLLKGAPIAPTTAEVEAE